MQQRIEDYALIGDRHTGALVGRDASIDWLCLPCFDSPAAFAALLGDAGNGCWRIAPAGKTEPARRRYQPDTLILETEFQTPEGRVRLTDFMPVGGRAPRVVRLVTGLAGRVRMHMDLIIRFDYGRLVPWVMRESDGGLSALAGPHLLVLRTPAPHQGKDLTTVSDFEVGEGQTVPFVLSYGASFEERPKPLDPDSALRKTQEYWTEWARRCSYEGPWREAVVRSLITLKALTFEPTGGIIAAPTTSLPEQPASTRNWDYRYCWLRDATFTLLSLMAAGYREEAADWRNWLVRAIAGKASQVQPLYTILGENRVDEWEVPWLNGFADARPVRIGNAAFSHLQLDIFGEVLDALHHARRGQLAANDAAWAIQRALLEHLESIKDLPDRGIWEVRGEPRHFTHSKVMIWVAFDRAVSAAEHFGLEGPVEHWRRLRDDLHREICEKGFDSKRGAFVQAYGSAELDASALLFPLVGFLPASDPRIAATVKAIETELMTDGLIHRYRTSTAKDGLPPGEGAFLACNFWLADNMVLLGRREEAVRLVERLLALRNDVGLLAEQYQVAAGAQIGNFPQALSHLALVDTAYNLLDSTGPAHERSQRGRANRTGKGQLRTGVAGEEKSP